MKPLSSPKLHPITGRHLPTPADVTYHPTTGHTDSPTSPTPGLTTETHPSAETHASTESPPTTTNETNSHNQAGKLIKPPLPRRKVVVVVAGTDTGTDTATENSTSKNVLPLAAESPKKAVAAAELLESAAAYTELLV
ncbi:hypothetical protein Tco_1167714 [Tanacetum coccineum]